MQRREFITLLGGTVAAWPLAARAQQTGAVRRIGVMMPFAAADAGGQALVASLRRGLKELGWTEDRNIRIEERWAAGDTDRIRKHAAELVALAPDVIVGNGTAVLTALRQATRTIPIVFIAVADPVGQGLVASLARPGGAVTGFGVEEPSMGGKWLDLLKTIAPHVARLAIIFNPDTAPQSRMFLPSITAAGLSSTVEWTASPVVTEAEIKQVIGATGRDQIGGLMFLPDPFTYAHRELIIALAARHRLPAIYPSRSFAESGGLIAYGINRVELYRHAASYVDRILKGAKMADLPVQMPTIFELVINLTTAKALGLTIPPGVLAIADEVIE
jgi:putative tryptophan/tyrosine transport system substrate-binding protein